MNLPKGCIHFNSELEKPGGTPSWGQELGQVQPDYLIKREGASEIINGMLYNMVEINNDFDYGPGGSNFIKEMLAVFNKVILKVYDGENKKLSQYSCSLPLILLIGKETTPSHNGRRVLKLNPKFRYQHFSNTEFYNEVNVLIGNAYPWFSRAIEYDVNNEGKLFLTFIKAPIPATKYPSADVRGGIWERLCIDYDSIYSTQEQLSNVPKEQKLETSSLATKDFIVGFKNYSFKKGYEFN